MPRRRVNRRPQNTRQPFVDVDHSTDSSNNSTNATAVWRREYTLEIIIRGKVYSNKETKYT